MSYPTKENRDQKLCRNPHVLVVERDEAFGKAVAAALQKRSIRAKHTKSVDDYLDLNCTTPIDLVSLEVDALDPETLDNLRLLRTHFGEGPGTRIVAVSSFAPDAFPILLEQHGADVHVPKRNGPYAVAIQLETHIHRTSDH